MPAPLARTVPYNRCALLTAPSTSVLSTGVKIQKRLVRFSWMTFWSSMITVTPSHVADAVVAAIKGGTPIDMPVAAIETKGDWTDSPAAGMYQISDGTTSYGLDGLHIMVKIAPDPKNVQSSPDPSWFWTTFEFKGNP